MNKKQLITTWIKKILAFVLDLVGMIILAYILVLVLSLIMGFLVHGVPYSELNDDFKTILGFISFLFKVVVIWLYFWMIPKKIGNTFGRKLLKIEDKINIFWMWSFLRNRDKFPAQQLKKNEILKVFPKDGYWICPSCKEKNKELQDACSNCGQEIES